MRLIALLAVIALAVPAAAAAGSAKHKPTPRHARQVAIAKNSAWVCKALRAQDRTAFRTFGTNKNGRNAFGKCVSQHARSKRLHGVTLTFHDLTVASTGTITNAGAPNCQASTAGCTITSTGKLLGALHGTYAATWTIRWDQATANGSGGFCAPATGTTTLTLPGLGTLTKSEQGTVCEVGATGANVEHVLQNGTFTVSSGTGLFAHATGSGTVSFDQKPGTVSSLGGAVTGSETFTTLTITL